MKQGQKQADRAACARIAARMAERNKQILTVIPNVDFHGLSGFGYDGWAGETPEEAVLESFLQAGMTYGEATDKLAACEIRVQEG